MTTLVPRGALAQIVAGAGYPLRGLAFIAAQRLWRWAFAAVMVNVAALAAALYGAAYLVWPRVRGLVAWVGGVAGDSAWLGALAWLFAGVLWTLAALFVGVVAVTLVLLVGRAIASPFLDLLSEQIETIVLGRELPPMSAARLWASMRLAFSDLARGLVLYALIQLPLALLGLLPVVGTGPATVGSVLAGALFLAHEFVGLPLVRRMVGYGERWRLVRANPWLCLGFGLTAALLTLVPFLNFALLPLAAAGGTLLYCDLERAASQRSP